MPQWPMWWEWELELLPHVLKRMVDRSFTETDLRDMLERAHGYRPDQMTGRFAVDTTHVGQAWVVIVEPDEVDELLVVVTAYPYP